jgi:hypothetical protein
MIEDEQKQPKIADLSERERSKKIPSEELAAALQPAGESPGGGTDVGQSADVPETHALVKARDKSITAESDETQSLTQTAEAVHNPELVSEVETSEIVRKEDTAAEDEEVHAASRRHTRRSFLGAGIATAAAYGFYHYLGSNSSAEMQPPPFRDAYRFNAWVTRKTFRGRELAPTYPPSQGENLRINGVFGMKMDLELESWRLQLVGMSAAAKHSRFVEDVTAWAYTYKASPGDEDQGHDTKVDPNIATAKKMAPESMQAQAEEDENHTGRLPRGTEEAGESHSTLSSDTSGLLLRIEDITKLPRHELVTEFKCIEGWSQIVHWAGVRMADFLELYPPEKINGKDPLYVYMETPDGDYYTGYDLDVMRHPQTLLVTEMMGAPLTQLHGAPLRLHMPTKYGYKQIKRIGLIAYTDNKPDDYWTKLGYDWYGGL